MRVVTIVGTRPQLIKAAALLPVLQRHHDVVFIDTGQHYDEEMAGTFFAELGLPRPHHALAVGGGSVADQVARMLLALEPLLIAEHPDAILVIGDTNSTFAGAMAGATLGIPVAHVEAGLRSFDRRMPEELNRILTDHLASLLFAPTPTALTNLANEGIRDGVHAVGDLMQDLASRVSDEVRDPVELERIAAHRAWAAPVPEQGRYLFATVHRAENREVDAVRAWSFLLGAAGSEERPVILALHPGTRAVMATMGASLPPNVHAVAPQGYRSTLALQLHAAAVLTDSGGVQREAAWLGTPCLVLRGTTEWVELLEGAEAQMVVVGLDADDALDALARLAPPDRAPEDARTRAATRKVPSPHAAEAIVDALTRTLTRR
jgi:UDP-N-acetylglucosamine 2-epimerase